MRVAKLFVSVASVLVLTTGVAFADKVSEVQEFNNKPWELTDLPQLNSNATGGEVEPNDACGAGNAYTLGTSLVGAIADGDQDWFSFDCAEGDVITIGTDTAGGTDMDTVIELWDDACGATLTSNDDGGPGLYSLIDGFVAPYTGTYNLLVRGFSSTSAGDYTLLGDCQTPAGPGFCPIGLYKASKINVGLAIPDNDPAGLTTPAIKFNPQPGFVITDVVIDMNIEHTWVGDLIITLKHTSDSGQVRTVDLVQRPGVPETGFGCSGDLIGDPEAKYFFGNSPQNPIGENDCPGALPAECYAVAPENAGGLSIFNGIDKGDGIWELCISDNAAGDLGIINNWSVHLLCEQPISVEEASWSTIKAVYGTE